MNESGRSILFCAITPPPVNGMTLVTSEFAKALMLKGFLLVDPSCKLKGLHWLPWKVHRLCLYIWYILNVMYWIGVKKIKLMYMVANADWGLIYNVMMCIVVKLFGARIIVHHHTYKYINQQSRLMVLLACMLNETDIFIFLSNSMRIQFSEKYRTGAIKHVLENYFMYHIKKQTVFSGVESRSASRNVGFMSNLTKEKGVDEFLLLAEKSLELGKTYVFNLAGPCRDKELLDRIRVLAVEHPKYFRYWHSVYGEEKNRFLRELDVFIFPTLYQNEAQPLVLLEALSYGIPIIAYDRGVISEVVRDGCGLIVSNVSEILNVIVKVSAYDRDRIRKVMTTRCELASESIKPLVAAMTQAT